VGEEEEKKKWVEAWRATVATISVIGKNRAVESDDDDDNDDVDNE
jgi:hypothetical protein